MKLRRPAYFIRTIQLLPHLNERAIETEVDTELETERAIGTEMDLL